MLDRCRGALLVAAGAYLVLLPTGAGSFWRSLAFGGSALLAVAVLVLRRRSGAQPLPLPGRAIPIAVVAWALWSFASLVWSVDPRLTAAELKADVLWGLVTIGVFYVAATSARDAFERLAATLIGAFAFWTALAVGIALSAHGWDARPFHRGDGAFATYLVTAAPFLLLLAWRPPVGFNRGTRAWLAVALMLLLLIATARMSENRVVWIALAASLVVAMLAAPRSGRPWRLMAGAGAVALVFALLFADAAHERATHLREDASVSGTFADDPRLTIWMHTRARILERPWLGYGYGLHILGREIGRDTGDAAIMHPHNLFASQWLQTGAIGLTLFVALLGAMALRFVRFARAKDVALARLGAIGLAVLVAFAIRNLTDDFFLRANGKLLFAACAILLGAGMLREAELESFHRPRAGGGPVSTRPSRGNDTGSPPTRGRPDR